MLSSPSNNNNNNSSMISSPANQQWAKSLVGRDWEIYWNDEEDKEDSPAKEVDTISNMEICTEEKENVGTKNDNEDEDEDEDSEQGSIIDDWYAGKVLSLEPQDGDKLSFKVHFVGDEEIYDMDLEPNKVRPSARGWIKRTKALLCARLDTDDKPWDAILPPDTSTWEDQSDLNNLQSEVNSKTCRDIGLTDRKDGVEIPGLDDLKKILHLRYLLQAQIFLRSRLATIVNHHGSTKFVGGEPNPTEAHVNNLTECCRDLNQACEWYCKCWELLTTFFGQSPSSTADRSITFDNVFDEYLEFGKNCLVNCASMDLRSTTSKRRQLLSPTSNKRRPKRRRKNASWGSSPDHVLESVADEGDLRSTSFVDQFVRTLEQSTESWFLVLFGRMLQTVSHFVVDPLLTWRRKASLLIGDKSELGDAMKDEDDNEDEKENSDSGDEGSESSGEKEQQFFTVEAIEFCIRSLEEDPVLSLLDLSREEGKLKTKLAAVQAIATKATELLQRIAEDTGDSSKNSDEVLEGLKAILTAVQSPDHCTFNVEPIGRVGSPLTRDLLANAIEIRSWLNDVKHAEAVRERRAFIELLVARTNQLPSPLDMPMGVDGLDLLRRRKDAERAVHSMHGTLSEYDPLFEKYSLEIGQRQGNTGILSKEGALEALKELAKCTVISVAEEEISSRVDILDWREEAGAILRSDTTRIEYAPLEKLFTSLELILSGRSQTRRGILVDVTVNDKVESEVCSFASTDAKSICGSLMERATSLYFKASQWKERAEAAISTLRMHGNPSAGEILAALKLPGMVDIKRIDDLVSEYESLGVEVPEYTDILQRVQEDANKWSTALETTIMAEDISLEKCLSFLVRERECRPKGIIMDPTRHAYDSLLDFLGWHTRVNENVQELAADTSKASRQVDVGNSSVEKYSTLLVSTIYPLLGEGADVVEVYERARDVSGQFRANSQLCGQVLEKLYGIRKSSRALSRERLESHPLGSCILSRMVRVEVDLSEGLPLFFLLWVEWHLFVADFVSQCDDVSDSESESNNTTSGCPRSLAEARDLRAQQPLLPDIDGVGPSDVLLLLDTKTTELERLDCVIKEAEQVESEIRDLLSRSKDMLKGSIHKVDLVRQHLSQLKESLKDRVLGEGGLSLSPALGPQLERHIKVFTWLVRTFPYPLLHLDEASYSAPFESDEDEASRVPWDVLISLYDRIPCEVEERSGDFALMSLRVRELYSAAKKWQDEITRNTMLTIRGGKRRAPAGSSAVSPDKSEQEQDASSKLEMEKMKQLADNPVLYKVAMPREGAVNGIVESSNEFEVQLHSFLGTDYEGPSPDRAAFPDSGSLVGKKGEFILFRLTGSELFELMQVSMHALSLVAENVLAETPGKATFDWIRLAVLWIERLADAVTIDSPFEDGHGNILVIPGTEARAILKDGKELFLTIPEDLKKTLSQHGIFVSTNKQERTLRVTLKKDGAQHSVGGTVIRWIPILFDSLRADVSRLERWEKELTRILIEFNKFFSETRDHPKHNEKNLYRWYCFREQVSTLLNDGAESLLVAPQQGLVNSFRNLLNSIQNYLTKHSKPEYDRRCAKKWFAQSTSLLDDRFLLLESLLYRKALLVETTSPPISEQSETSFRDTCRAYIGRSLSKALKVFGMTDRPETIKSTNLESHAAIKAWEIESEMYDRFQEELGLAKVSDEYRNKARSLRWSLEDKHNVSLCIRVLLGDISAAELVSMPPVQLASQKAKRERAMAAKVAMSWANLTPEIKADEPAGNLKEPPQYAIMKESETPKSSLAGLASEIKGLKEVDSFAKVKIDGSAGDDDAKVTGLSESSKPRSVLKRSESPMVGEMRSPAALKALMKAKTKNSRPPPPPSLVNSFQQRAESPTPDVAAAPASKDRGMRVMSSLGGDKFRIEIANSSTAFYAAFYLEDESQVFVNRFLPDSFSQKGRLNPDAFASFLSDKLSGGRWVAIPLRLTTITDGDAKEYKKFYREYEIKMRIAMFEVSKETKVFLVSPKFHGAAKGTGLVSLSNKNSTYAIVLTKAIGVLKD